MNTIPDSNERPRKTGNCTVPLLGYHKILNSSSALYVIFRLALFSCFVVIIFIVYIAEEFTFIFNYKGYGPNLSNLKDHMRERPTNSFLKRHAKNSKLLGENIKYIINNTDYNITENHKQAKYGNTSMRNLSNIDENDDWRYVTDEIYAYSAFWDNRIENESFIRIIAGAQIVHENLNSTKCLLKYNSYSSQVEVIASYEILPEHHNKESKVVYFKCTVTTARPPMYVALLPMNWNDTWIRNLSYMVVHSVENDTSLSNIGVCIRAMFNFTDVFRIAEFVAYYEALGVSHFTFYNYDASDDVIYFLQQLQKNYSIDVLSWSLPDKLHSMWELGQLASINDCIYRQIKNLMYVVVVDLDEFITPRHVLTLHEILAKQDISKQPLGNFIIRSCVFCSEHTQDILPSEIPPFQTQISIYRENYIYPYKIRSKYIAKPRAIEVGGVHTVWKLISGWSDRFVPTNQVLVHHYRKHLCIGWNSTLKRGELDVQSRKYLNQLMRSRAVSDWKSLFSI